MNCEQRRTRMTAIEKKQPPFCRNHEENEKKRGS